MLYICGLLFLSNKSRSIESLSVEIWAADPHGRVIHSGCPSWRDSGNTGFAETFGIEESRDREEDEENVSTKHVDDRISFLLQPLALRKSVGKTEVVFCSPYKPSDNLRNTMDHYKALLRGERHTTYRDTNWLRTEYFSILAKRKECAKQIRQDREQRHEEWLRKTHEQYSCRHPRFKRYSRCCKNAYCEGCNRWLESLTQCRSCEMRACERCRADLRRKWSVFEEEKRVRLSRYLLPRRWGTARGD